jgi:hypothetical protein
VAQADLGWSEAQYVKRYGAPGKSPITPDQVRFERPAGGMLLVRFASGRSREELWEVDRDNKAVPERLMKGARKIASGKPTRVIEFKTPRAPAAELYEQRQGAETIRVDMRNRSIRRIAVCSASRQEPCVLFDQALNTERQTDALLAPAAIDMMRGRRH